MCLGFWGQAQKELYSSGLKYFEAKQYDKALEYFYADKYSSNNKDLLIRRVIANYNVGKLDAAKQDVAILLTFDSVPEELYLYIGKIFHAESNYRKAVEYYKIYLRKLSRKSPKRKSIIHLIKQCGEALKIRHQEPRFFVDNYGSEINTKYDEFRMIQSPNFENKYYFSSARESSTGGKRAKDGKKNETFGTYNSDMYAIELVQGKWMEAEKLNPFINTSRDEIALDFSPDGGVLYYMKGPDYTKGTIYLDSFAIKQENTLSQTRFDAVVQAEIGDIYLQVFSEDVILFSSKRNGGYGGYDIYMSYKQDDQWSKAINLGPSINTPYDEVSPFMTNDGLSIYFSSNRIKSIGGFDVFQSEFDQRTQSWKNPVNLGQPINSSEDDLFFHIADNGFTANLTSDRKPGYGGYDLFVVYFKEHETHQHTYASDVAFLQQIEFVPSTQMVSNTRGDRSDSLSKASKRKKQTKRRDRRKNKTNQDVVQARPISPKDGSNNNSSISPDDGSSNLNNNATEEEYTINPLLYTSNLEILTPANRKELDVMYRLLSTYPTIKLVIKSFTIEEGVEAYDLYFSIKRAEAIAEHLTKQGINSDRISLHGYGSNYPIAKTETGGKPSKIAEKLNSRIEFQLINTDQAPVKVNLVEPYIADYLRDERGQRLKRVEEGLSYRVQIASAKQMYQNQVLLIYNDSMIEKESDTEYYRYTLGLYESHTDARTLVKDLADYSINGAFIVPFLEGQRIPKERLLDYAKHYPDLLNFIQYNNE